MTTTAKRGPAIAGAAGVRACVLAGAPSAVAGSWPEHQRASDESSYRASRNLTPNPNAPD